MRRRWVICVLGLLIAGAVMLVMTRSNLDEPLYQGRPLRSWIGILRHPKSSPARQQTARDAIKAMGTNAIPGLLNSFYRPMASPWAKVYRLLGNPVPSHLELSDDWYITQLQWVDPAIRRPVQDAMFAVLLGMGESPQTSDHIKLEFMRAFSYLDDDSQEFIAEKLTNSVPQVRKIAAGLIGTVGDPPVTFLPALGQLVVDQDPQVRWAALNVLTRYRPRRFDEATLAVAIDHLRQGLHDPDLSFRRMTAFFLARYIERARPAIPDLIRLADETNDRTYVDAIFIIDRVAVSQLKSPPGTSATAPP